MREAGFAMTGAPPRRPSARRSDEPAELATARRRLAAYRVPLASERVAVSAAGGRFLAGPCVARADLVPYARSAMDGYAVRARDTAAAAHAPLVLAVRGSSFAGDPRTALEPGRAGAIATGGPLPDGADAVVPWEDVDVRGETIVLRAPLRPGQHVFAPADDARAGETVARRGERISPGRAALLAAIGISEVEVHRAPRVTIVSTGNELVDPSCEPRFGQVRDSNAAMLAANVARDGGHVAAIVRVRDREADVRDALRDAFAHSDLVVTTGGASGGERDHVKAAAEALGADFAFSSVALRPGRPTAFARHGAVLLAILPGNPAAAFVAYATLFAPLVRALCGDPSPEPRSIAARLDGSLHAKAGRHYFAFVALRHDDDGFVAKVLTNQCSSLVRTAAEANAFAVVPPGERVYRTGDTIETEVFDWDAVSFAARDHANGN